MDKVKPKVLGLFRDVEQLNGFVVVKLVIDKTGNLKSAAVQPPHDHTRTAERREARAAQSELPALPWHLCADDRVELSVPVR